ncbi:MAG: type IIA DNA topoisomerase subunit B [Micrococcales bacterium]|nr:type IIA DNA topoisomerase subunit B [Micrococcales bacterium]
MSLAPPSQYTAHHLQVLEGLEAVRKRPGMFIGSTDQRGLMHCAWEIIDNAVDEALAGYCDQIIVTLHPDGSLEVEDNGRGIPVDIEPKTGLNGVEVVFTKLHAGGKFGGSGSNYGAAGGLHGVGASVVNALSARMDVSVTRGGKVHAMSFHRGEPGTFTDKASGPSPDAPFTPFLQASTLRVTGRAPAKRTGTKVRFWPDNQIFPEPKDYNWQALLDRARQSSFLLPGLTLQVVDKRANTGPQQESFKHAGGVVDFVEFLAPDTAIQDTWHIQGQGVFTETVQQLDAAGHLAPVQVERVCQVEAALRWGTGYETNVLSFVNVIATPKGGSHLAGFEQGLLKAVRVSVEATSRRLKVSAKETGIKIEKDDALAGLTAVVTVRLAEPQFEGQTKEVLGTAPVRGIVAKVMAKTITKRLAATKPNAKAQAHRILEKIVAEMRARLAARTHKEISRRKNALETSSMPAKLVDCRSSDVAQSELFIVEGDSALGTARPARDSNFQALLPIRGKILNTQKASVTDMLKNAECAAIIQVIGAGSGRTFDLEQARYGKVILMTDADVDGAHIRTLLLTLFFRYMRPMVEAGRVFAAVPPLHRVQVKAGRGGKTEHIYTYSEAELKTLLTRLDRSGRAYTQPIQRFKGLGEMDAGQLAETTMDRDHRTLRRVRVSDAAAADQVFELLMGNEVAPRREFIIDGAADLDRDGIDA